MKPITEGSRCLVVGSYSPRAIGRFVTARVYLHDEMTSRGIRSGWLVAAAWLNPDRPSIWPARWLVRLDGPDEADEAVRRQVVERDWWLALQAERIWRLGFGRHR